MHFSVNHPGELYEFGKPLDRVKSRDSQTCLRLNLQPVLWHEYGFYRHTISVALAAKVLDPRHSGRKCGRLLERS